MSKLSTEYGLFVPGKIKMSYTYNLPLARDAVLDFVRTHRRSVGYLVEAAHQLEFSYPTIYKIKKEHIEYVKEQDRFSVYIKDKDNCIVDMRKGDWKKMRALFKWLEVKKPLRLISAMLLIKNSIKVLGVHVDGHRHLPDGFILPDPDEINSSELYVAI